MFDKFYFVLFDPEMEHKKAADAVHRRPQVEREGYFAIIGSVSFSVPSAIWPPTSRIFAATSG